MKLQTTKKLFAFIIIMMFSTININAQCPGNKVLMHHGRGCIEKCVPTSQFDKYISQGWIPGPCPITFFFVQNGIKKIPNKPLIKIPVENNIVSNKIFRR